MSLMDASHGHLGPAELAQALGVSRQRLHQLRQTYQDFPAPIAELARGPIWHTSDIERWQRQHETRPSGVHVNTV